MDLVLFLEPICGPGEGGRGGPKYQMFADVIEVSPLKKMSLMLCYWIAWCISVMSFNLTAVSMFNIFLPLHFIASFSSLTALVS